MEPRETVSIYLVEQATAGLYGEYLTECVVAAPNARKAREAACALADPVDGFGITVRVGLLKVTLLGPCRARLTKGAARFVHHDALVLAVGTGRDTL